MNFSQYAGVAIVPTLSRLVLAAAFVHAGYNKVFTSSEFEATADGTGKANKLHELGVSLTAPPPRPVTGIMDRWDGQWHIVRAGYRQEAEPAVPPAAPPVGEGTPPTPPPSTPLVSTPPASPPPTSADQPPAATTAPAQSPAATSTAALVPGKYYAPSLHHVTLLVAQHNWPMPVMQGWAAAVTELVGGALLLIGLFSRVWGLGLAIVMGVAFYFTSLPVLQTTAILSIPHMEQLTMFIQVSFFVLAFGIFLTGPGPLSMDRILFDHKPSQPMPPGDPKAK